MTIVEPTLAYLCPACGNPYYSSSIGSYSIFDPIRFSDGSSEPNFYLPLWVTRCPECQQFFSKNHLFLIPFPDMRSEERIRMVRRYRREKRNYGSCDNMFMENESKVSFLEKAMKQGLYFPITVGEHQRKKETTELGVTLWWEYNRRQVDCDDEKYPELCKWLISRWDDSERVVDSLTMAELYRNIGDFEQSKVWLDKTEDLKENLPYIECIRKQLEIGNRKPVTLGRKEREEWKT